jgi:hypothetical protein
VGDTTFTPFNSHLLECKVRRHAHYPAVRSFAIEFLFEEHTGIPGDRLVIEVEPEDLERFAALTEVQMQEILKAKGKT